MKQTHIGNSVDRIDSLAKVTGKAMYPQDYYFDNMLYGKTLRSIYPFAKINIDLREAQNLPGVVRIFTHKDVPNNAHGVLHKDQLVFCEDIVRRIGDPIAFVVAETQKICEEAIEK
jgi:Aerobic-type carbon monoxide dehydrogenase, large subunit CoxL/CutL homologs